MKITASSPPAGTVRDWVNSRADSGDAGFTFCDGSAPLSYPELRDAARALASDLTERGLGKGESVAILFPNSRNAIIGLFGALYGGFRATMINLVAGDDAISYALEHSEARFALVDEHETALFERTADTSRIQRLEMPAEAAGVAPLHDIEPGDHALLMYTSGTTGRPKGVVHTHASLLAGGWTTAIAHRLTSQDRGLAVLPIFHINGLCVTVMGSLVSGGTLALAERFSASRFWDMATDCEVTWFSVVPTIISHLLHSDKEPGEAARNRIRFGRSASAPLAPDVHTAFENRFGVPIIETMGLTETAAQILSNPLPPAVRKIGSPGIAYGNEIAIFDKKLQRLPAGAEGELAVRGPNVMQAYFKNAQATADTMAPGGWLRTGDLGRVDEDGYVFVTGRLKELIIKGGENIAPREIDEALYSHPDVVEAAAFARPCDSYGERVEAAVKLCSGSALTESALRDICEARLGKFKCPDRIHFLGDLPKGPSGKVQRKKLQELLLN